MLLYIYIYIYQLIGGEPLLNKNLPQMLEYACKKKQIKVVSIVTNTTILPSKDLLSVMNKYKHKIIVHISDYTNNARLKNLKLKEVVDKFKKEGLVVSVVDYPWTKRGIIKKANRNKEALQKTMLTCWQRDCQSYCDGEFHLCSRSIGIKRNVDNTIQDFVQVVGNKNAAQEIINLFLRKYVDACDYCHTEMDTKIPRGIQVGDVENTLR